MCGVKLKGSVNSSEIISTEADGIVLDSWITVESRYFVCLRMDCEVDTCTDASPDTSSDSADN